MATQNRVDTTLFKKQNLKLNKKKKGLSASLMV